MKNLTFLLVLIIAACSKDNSIEINRQEVTCDEQEIANHGGTICCVSGAIEALPGDTLTYEYKSNRAVAVSWEVRSGDITIIEGGNSASAIFKFGDNFTEGEIVGIGYKGLSVCSEVLKITGL